MKRQYFVYIESFYSALKAIAAEKKIKGMVRSKKMALIVQANPTFKDLLLQKILRFTQDDSTFAYT